MSELREENPHFVKKNVVNINLKIYFLFDWRKNTEVLNIDKK